MPYKKMKNTKIFFSQIALLFFAFLFFVSCNSPTYPKASFEDSIKSLIAKETGIDVSTYVNGSTIYIDMVLESLLSTNEKEFSDEAVKLQSAVSNVVRVVLSSDAGIEFIVVNAHTPDDKILINIVNYLRDAKDFYFSRISNEDYQSRNILQILTSPVDIERILNDKHALTLDEFVGMLIVYNVSNGFMSNPFLAQILLPMRPVYEGVQNGVVIARTDSARIDPETQKMFRQAFLKQGLNFIGKYSTNIKSIELINPANRPIIRVRLEESDSSKN
jgi:hypothetical protein